MTVDIRNQFLQLKLETEDHVLLPNEWFAGALQRAMEESTELNRYNPLPNRSGLVEAYSNHIVAIDNRDK